MFTNEWLEEGLNTKACDAGGNDLRRGRKTWLNIGTSSLPVSSSAITLTTKASA